MALLQVGVLGMLAVSILTGAAEAQSGAVQGTISGTVTYRERIALPGDAAIDVRLEDVSQQDAPAKLVAESIFASAGKQVPIPFQLSYNPADIDPSHQYNIRAIITVNGNKTFVTTTAYPVLTRGAGSEVTVMLQQAQPHAADKKAPGAKLHGTHWTLTELNGNPPAAGLGNRPVFLEFHEDHLRIAGSSGCNNLLGTYIVEKHALQITPTASTMMM